MKLSIQIAAEYNEEPEVIIQAQRLTPEVQRFHDLIANEAKQFILMGEQDGVLYPVDWQDVIHLVVDGRGVVAEMLDGKRLTIKMPLYALEEMAPQSICRISKSELIQLNHLKSLKPLPNGLIKIQLARQITTYCSRHYVRNIKERLK